MRSRMKDNHQHCYHEVNQHIAPLGGTVPAHRQAARHAYSFSSNSFAEQLLIWDYIWHHSTDFWTRLHAFFFLERHMRKDKALEEMWPVIVKWQGGVTDWGLCDSLSKIYTRMLELAPEKVYRVLKAWNKDKDLWKRRQSVVSLLYYSRTKKVYLPFNAIEPLITGLLSDKEYYVQKGVGWALREMHNVYPKETKAYLEKNIRKVSSIAFTIAMEKMGEAEKNKFKALRKQKIS